MIESSWMNELGTELKSQPRLWLITGVAGFIGSNLLEALLRLGQEVRGLDNLSTGSHANLKAVRAAVTPEQWKRFSFFQNDLREPDVMAKITRNVDIVLHQAALGSVPRSMKDPFVTHDSNVNGTLILLDSCRVSGVKRIVYASSSSVYGDDPGLPKVEERTGHVLSPYAASKQITEIYAQVFGRCYGIETVGLRYFNVFGRRQSPDGPYAAVIPKWFQALLRREPVEIYGDGQTSRDFCYVENVVQANLRAGLATDPRCFGRVFNIAVGETTSLLDLYRLIGERIKTERPAFELLPPLMKEFRTGDIRHSLADISAAGTLLAYRPTHTVRDGLIETTKWYMAQAPAEPKAA